MNTVSVVNQNNLVAQNDMFSRDKIELIKKTIANGASDNELQLFIEQCRRTKLDPITRQIYAVMRKTYNKQTKAYENRMTIQVSIDGFRLIAQRSLKYAGQLGPYWCGSDGVWKDVWLADKPPSAAKVGVLHKDFSEPLWAVARFDAYAQKFDSGLSDMWQKFSAEMIAKCAEALALRKAFPNDLSGLYTSDEMAQVDSDIPKPNNEVANEIPSLPLQAESSSTSITVEPIKTKDVEDDFPFETPSPQVVSDDYVIPFGQYTGKSISSIDAQDLKGYYDYCKRTAEAQAQKEGRPVRPQMAEFLNKAQEQLRLSGFLSQS